MMLARWPRGQALTLSLTLALVMALLLTAAVHVLAMGLYLACRG